MNRFRKKVQAFTLSEMLVVLLITLIVVGLAFTVLNLVQKQMGSLRNGFEDASERTRFKQVLWKDFRTYSRVYYQESANQLICENPKETIIYQFQEKLVIRAMDSFAVDVKSKTGYFLGASIVSGELDALQLEMNDPGKSSFLVYKTNTAESYMDYGF